MKKTLKLSVYLLVVVLVGCFPTEQRYTETDELVEVAVSDNEENQTRLVQQLSDKVSIDANIEMIENEIPNSLPVNNREYNLEKVIPTFFGSMAYQQLDETRYTSEDNQVLSVEYSGISYFAPSFIDKEYSLILSNEGKKIDHAFFEKYPEQVLDNISTEEAIDTTSQLLTELDIEYVEEPRIATLTTSDLTEHNHLAEVAKLEGYTDFSGEDQAHILYYNLSVDGLEISDKGYYSNYTNTGSLGSYALFLVTQEGMIHFSLPSYYSLAGSVEHQLISPLSLETVLNIFNNEKSELNIIDEIVITDINLVYVAIANSQGGSEFLLRPYWNIVYNQSITETKEDQIQYINNSQSSYFSAETGEILQ